MTKRRVTFVCSQNFPNLFCRRCLCPVCCRKVPLIRSLALCQDFANVMVNFRSSMLAHTHSNHRYAIPYTRSYLRYWSLTQQLTHQYAYQCDQIKSTRSTIAKLLAIQQSPVSSSSGKQCFCFFGQTTTIHASAIASVSTS